MAGGGHAPAAGFPKEVGMSYRYSVVDVIVGVGMSAIMFGTILFFVATTGTFNVMSPLAVEAFPNDPTGMTWLQPALGQAIVDQMVMERKTHLINAETVSEWNRATMAYHGLQSTAGPFGSVNSLAMTVPMEHTARVQGVMGRSIVNFTRRGIHSGVLSAAHPASEFNARMISRTEAMGQKLEETFVATWQPTLGRAILDAAERYSERTASVQAQLGSAIVHMTHAQVTASDEQAANQQQMAGLLMAAIRTDALSDRLQLLAALESMPDQQMAASTRPASWPDIPLAFMMAAMVAMGTVFFAGVLLSAMAREAKIQADRNREMSRWAYRVAV